jgi:hypothetical protein
MRVTIIATYDLDLFRKRTYFLVFGFDFSDAKPFFGFGAFDAAAAAFFCLGSATIFGDGFTRFFLSYGQYATILQL